MHINDIGISLPFLNILMTSQMVQSDLVNLYAPDSSDCWGAFDYTTTIIIIILSCVLGIVWAVFNFIQVRKVDVASSSSGSSSRLVSEVS